MEDLSKLSYLELTGRANAVRIKAQRYDKINHPDRDDALKDLMLLDNAIKNIEASFPRFTGNTAHNDVFPYYATDSKVFIESDHI
jgi:hypothetical protein